MPTLPALAALLVYGAAVVALLPYGLNCLVLLALHLRSREGAARERARVRERAGDLGRAAGAPLVTTQIPIYNEMNVAARVIEAACRMRYAPGRHEVQVLDDSTDATRALVDRTVARLRAQGHRVTVVRRRDRAGFKAGALAHGLRTARGELCAVFDADFVPPPDYLLRTVPFFLARPEVGFVQCRWGHLNRERSLLTRAQAIGIDGHFMVEQSARAWSGLVLNFNGTAGIWRRAAIEDAGGWQGDTLTEDLDLSYRARLAGWQAAYLPDVIVPAEIPEDVNAFKSQQFRWAKGSIETALKLLPRVLASDLSAFTKLQAFLHLTHYAVHPLMVILALLSLPALLGLQAALPPAAYGALGVVLAAAMLAPNAMYVVSQRGAHRDWRRRVVYLPVLATLGVGSAVSNSRAVLEAVAGRPSAFVRTPKRGERAITDYRVRLPGMAVAELALGAYCLASLCLHAGAARYVAAPFLALYAIGFGWVGLLSLRHAGLAPAATAGHPRTFQLGFARHRSGRAPRPAGRSGTKAERIRRGPGAWMWFGAACALLAALTASTGAAGRAGGWPALPLPLDLRLPAGWLIATYLASWLACLAAFLAFPGDRPFRRGAFAVLAAAAAVRLAALPQPASDDVNRYLWEGRTLAAGLSPYAHPPAAAPAADPAAERFRDPSDPLWRGINHPELGAIYPPLALAMFAAIASVSYDPLAVKIVVTALELAAIAVLLALLGRRRMSPRWAILYALNPLAVQAFAGEGHLDAAPLLFLLAAVWLAAARRWRLMFLALGLAVQMKYVAVLAIPFFITRRNLGYAWVATLAVAVPFLPFCGSDGGSPLATLLHFGSTMAFNGFVHGWLRHATGDVAVATSLAAAAAAVVFVAGLRHWLGREEAARDPAAGALFALSTFLVFAPTVHFWYLAPALALGVLQGSALWLVSSATVAFGFVANGLAAETGAFRFPGWAQAATWTLPAALLAGRLRRRLWPSFPAPRSVSVVIPARDESGGIERAVRAAAADACVVEVLVVDGGSADDTVVRARRAGARVLSHALPAHAGGGRGGQIARGLAAARGDVVAVVHADTLLRPGAMDEMVGFLAANPSCIGGALGAAFRERGWHLRAVELANRARAALAGISFGDQVQFFRREPVAVAGLYPAIPLMEDVELGLRLRRHGTLAFLWQANPVSARRWRAGSAARALLVVRLVAAWLVLRPLGRADAVAMYARYYGPHRSTRSDDRPRVARATPGAPLARAGRGHARGSGRSLADPVI